MFCQAINNTWKKRLTVSKNPIRNTYASNGIFFIHSSQKMKALLDDNLIRTAFYLDKIKTFTKCNLFHIAFCRFLN